MGAQTRGKDVVGVCDFPGCESSYVLSVGPGSTGWVKVHQFWAGLLLCPTHSGTAHIPSTQSRGTSLFVVCGCGIDLGMNPADGYAARQMWLDHLRRIGAS